MSDKEFVVQGLLAYFIPFGIICLYAVAMLFIQSKRGPLMKTLD